MERGEAKAHSENNRRERQRQHNQQRQAEAHLDFPSNRSAMRQRFGHGDADRPLERRVAVEAMCGVLPKSRTIVWRKHGRVRRMGLQQNASLGIAYDVGEELVMLPDRREALRHTLIFSPDDVGHGQRQDALGGFA